MRTFTRGERNIRWVEAWCVRPDGTGKAEPVKLSQDECGKLRALYDGTDLPPAVSDTLAAFVALLHVVGPEARDRTSAPPVQRVDSFTIWRAASARLQAFLTRHGERIVCRELGTSYPAAA
jgi:hypothetical protein